MTVPELERSFLCPYCWERQTVVVELSGEGEQRFVQDCEVCCNPIEFAASVCGGALVAFSVDAAGR